MKRHRIPIVAALCGALGLAGVLVMLIAMADVPRASYALLIGAFGLLCVALCVALAVLLVSNTRRPWGIDPNAPAANRARDPWAATTDELRPAVLVGDRPYGRRGSDDMQVVQRLIDKLEEKDTQRPVPAAQPQWALDLQQSEDARAVMAEKGDDDS